MQPAARALAADGRRLVALAPSARAAAVLARQVGVPATTLAKLLHAHATDEVVPAELVLGRGDVVLVDEAGMAGTPALGRLLEVVTRSGAVLRLVGDPMQLSAVEAGGALRLLVHHGDAAVLGRVHRFADPAEATASLQLRRGNPAASGAPPPTRPASATRPDATRTPPVTPRHPPGSPTVHSSGASACSPPCRAGRCWEPAHKE